MSGSDSLPPVTFAPAIEAQSTSSEPAYVRVKRVVYERYGVELTDEYAQDFVRFVELIAMPVWGAAHE